MRAFLGFMERAGHVILVFSWAFMVVGLIDFFRGSPNPDLVFLGSRGALLVCIDASMKALVAGAAAFIVWSRQ